MKEIYNRLLRLALTVGLTVAGFTLRISAISFPVIPDCFIASENLS